MCCSSDVPRPASGAGCGACPNARSMRMPVAVAQSRFGIDAGKAHALPPLEHGFTHFRLTMHPLRLAACAWHCVLRGSAAWLWLAGRGARRPARADQASGALVVGLPPAALASISRHARFHASSRRDSDRRRRDRSRCRSTRRGPACAALAALAVRCAPELRSSGGHAVAALGTELELTQLGGGLVLAAAVAQLADAHEPGVGSLARFRLGAGDVATLLRERRRCRCRFARRGRRGIRLRCSRGRLCARASGAARPGAPPASGRRRARRCTVYAAGIGSSRGCAGAASPTCASFAPPLSSLASGGGGDGAARSAALVGPRRVAGGRFGSGRGSVARRGAGADAVRKVARGADCRRWRSPATAAGEMGASHRAGRPARCRCASRPAGWSRRVPQARLVQSAHRVGRWCAGRRRDDFAAGFSSRLADRDGAASGVASNAPGGAAARVSRREASHRRHPAARAAPRRPPPRRSPPRPRTASTTRRLQGAAAFAVRGRAAHRAMRGSEDRGVERGRRRLARRRAPRCSQRGSSSGSSGRWVSSVMKCKCRARGCSTLRSLAVA